MIKHPEIMIYGLFSLLLFRRFSFAENWLGPYENHFSIASLQTLIQLHCETQNIRFERFDKNKRNFVFLLAFSWPVLSQQIAVIYTPLRVLIKGQLTTWQCDICSRPRINLFLPEFSIIKTHKYSLNK